MPIYPSRDPAVKLDEYAIYLRKSRADIELEAIEKMETLQRHRKILLELAKRQHLNVTDVYEEIVSGESIADRPEMQRLLDNVYKGKYKGVLVVEVERLARGNTRDQGEVAEAFKFSNTLIVTPTKTYDPNDEFDEEYFEFGLFMSRREYKTIRRRLQTGLLETVKEGNYVGSIPPYGYDKVQLDRKTKTLVKNENAQYVVMMFDWFVNERLSCGQIAKRLTSLGIPTLTGKAEWSRTTIRDILQNILYTGKIRWNRRKCSKEYDGSKTLRRKRRLTPDQSLVVDGKHEAIISAELFDKAQTLFTGTVPVNAGKKIINPLAGLIFCKHCGRSIAYQAYNHKPGTVPRFIHRESTVCKCKSSAASVVLEALVHSLEECIADFEVKISNGKQNDSNADLAAALVKELASVETRKDELMDYFERKIYTLEEFLTRREKLTARIEMIKAELAVEKSKATQVVDFEEKVVTFRQALATLQDPSIEAKIKNDFLKEIVSRIDYEVEDLGRQKGGIVHLDVYLL